MRAIVLPYGSILLLDEEAEEATLFSEGSAGERHTMIPWENAEELRQLYDGSAEVIDL